MTTRHQPIESGTPDAAGPEPQSESPAQGNQERAGSTPSSNAGSTRKTRQRSVYLFPAYGFTTALDIARRVEESGGGSLTEETLAINLGLSVKSSGFRLKSLAARQFQLIGKQGDTLITTPVAKAIFKPTSAADAQRGFREAFLSIPLFQAVAERYRGQRLPDSQTLRNVLEREFYVEHTRVQQAERMLLDSARDAHLLKHTGDGTYLVVAETSADDEPEGLGNGTLDALAARNGASHPPASAPMGAMVPANVLTFTIEEIGDLDSEEFETVWQALGILIRARRRRKSDATGLDDPAEFDALAYPVTPP